MTIHINSIEGPLTPISRVREIELTVAQTFGIDIEFIRSTTRKNMYVIPRQVVMYLLYRYTDMSLPEIGRTYRRDHTTVHHARVKITAAVDARQGPLYEKIQDVITSLRIKGFAV